MADLLLPRTLIAGQSENVNHVQENDEKLRDALNGDADCDSWEKLGVSVTAGSVRRGKSIIATEESRTNVAYGTLATPDQVSNVVLPTDGLIVVAFSGMYKSSAAAAGSAAIFIGANQLKADFGGATAPAVSETSTVGTDSYRHLVSRHIGLSTATGVWTGDVTTGQAITSGGEGPCTIFAAAGTYTVSVQFKASSGSVTVKERKLWVWTLGF